MSARWIGKPTLFNYYFDLVLKICAEEIDRRYPDGWGIPFEYRIPGECTNREQRRSKRMHGKDFLKWLLYTDDLVLFCPDIFQAEEIIIILNRVCKRFGLTISFKKQRSCSLIQLRLPILYKLIIL